MNQLVFCLHRDQSIRACLCKDDCVEGYQVMCHHVGQMAKHHLVNPHTEVNRKCEVVIGGTSDETFDVHVKWVRVGCECNGAAGCGETGSPLPKPMDYLFRSDEDIGGGGIALQALLLTLWVRTSTMPHRAFPCVSVHIHRETCQN